MNLLIKCSNFDQGVFVSETKPRDTKHTVVKIAIRYFNKDHIFMARSEAEDILPIK